jgi:hypothetical protein
MLSRETRDVNSDGASDGLLVEFSETTESTLEGGRWHKGAIAKKKESSVTSSRPQLRCFRLQQVLEPIPRKLFFSGIPPADSKQTRA